MISLIIFNIVLLSYLNWIYNNKPTFAIIFDSKENLNIIIVQLKYLKTKIIITMYKQISNISNCIGLYTTINI